MPQPKRKNAKLRKPNAQLSESDLAQDKMGNNQLQGDDQSNVRNQRHAVPDVKQEPDDSLIETMEKSDKNVRARRDLGKGKGVHPGKT